MDEGKRSQDMQAHEDAVTREGNPARPEGEAGAAMLARMNESHAAVTNWALDFLPLHPGMQAIDIGCGGGATLRRLAFRMGLVDEAGNPREEAREGACASDAGRRRGNARTAEDGRPPEGAREGGADESRETAGAGDAKAPEGGTGHVTGIDYSPVSCGESRAFNAAAVAAGAVDVVEGSVDALPFPDGAFDVATTVESFYFWPHPAADLREVRRVLKPGGTFLLVADVYRTPGLPAHAQDAISRFDMTVLDPEGYRRLFAEAGFSRCDVHLREGTTWICVEGTR